MFIPCLFYRYATDREKNVLFAYKSASSGKSEERVNRYARLGEFAVSK